MANQQNLEISLGRVLSDGPVPTPVTNEHLTTVARILSETSDLQYRFKPANFFGLGTVESITEVAARSAMAVTRAMAGQASSETLSVRVSENKIIFPTEILSMITNPEAFKRKISTALPVIFLNDTYIVGLNIPDSWVAQGPQITPVTLARPPAGGYRRGRGRRRTHKGKKHRKNRKTRR